jgi:membrane protein DedA with SNARE-associated domain
VLHWLHSLLPNVPHYGYVLVFVVVLLNNVGVPFPAEAVLLGAGFILGAAADALWQPMAAGTVAAFLGGICCFWLGRRLDPGRLDKIPWLHLTPERLAWPQRYLKRHGAKTIFVARFIAILPPMAANVLAGMTQMSWRVFLLYNLAGSALATVSYILLGYCLGKNWALVSIWLGPMGFYVILTAIIVVVPAVIFRHLLSVLILRIFARQPKRP